MTDVKATQAKKKQAKTENTLVKNELDNAKDSKILYGLVMS